MGERRENIAQIRDRPGCAWWRVFAWSFLFSGCNIFVSALFTALGNGKISALLSFLRTFGLLLTALLLLPRLWGLTGVWLAVPMAEASSFLLAWWLLYRYGGRYGLFSASSGR